MDLKGKVVFLTGGAQGLGRGYLEAMLEKGSKVFFGDVNESTGKATAKDLGDRFGPQNVAFVVLDVTDNKQFEEAFQQCVSHFGQVDIMVNNAGIMNESMWELMIKINVTAVVRGTKLAQEHMRKDKGGKGGRIINISSQAGLIDAPSVPIYAGTKHAVRSYTGSLALQPNVKETGIQYGILCPGPASTDLINKVDDQKVDFLDAMKEQLEKLTVPVSTIVDGFMDLVQLEDMNGAMLMVHVHGKSYMKMKMESLGTKWPVEG